MKPDKERVEEFARRIGMDAMDIKIQEGAYLAKHIEKCRKCQIIWYIANEMTTSHAKEAEI